MNTGLSYNQFYNILLNLRENFHKTGRIDDSNAKLDEILKLIMTSYSLAKRNILFSMEYVRKFSLEEYGTNNKIAISLKKIFESEIKNDYFLNNDGSNIFGNNPKLQINDSENEFAELLISEISKIDFYNLLKEKNNSNFDVINECFGHFVRDNFRNNKEDGQYMTPAEISKPISKMIMNILLSDSQTKEKIDNKKFNILDPTCGVGTLLLELEKEFGSYYNTEQMNFFKKNCIYGQDKVERMVRMSKMNFLLMGNNISNIKIGNSIIGNSEIDNLKDKLDLIISNPPFGADFLIDELDLSKYPFINSLKGKYPKIKSEILILDKSINLLKQGGYLAIVLPDGIFSSKGINEDLRNYLIDNFTIKLIVDLPAVAFAQAGTRTNTSIMLLKKEKTNETNKIKMIVCENLGYDVKERQGVPIKFEKGENDFVKILKYFNNDKKQVVSENPSVVNIVKNDLIGNVLKPNFYSAERYKTLEYAKKDNNDYVKLSQVVSFETKNRKGSLTSDTIKHISILHVNDEGIINYKEVFKFNPISKGRITKSNDILFSKLNPRISRICVVKEYPNYQFVCSNEFEIMRAINQEDTFLISRLLKTSFVQKQIESLTSGTSSSHSRIKTEQLMNILIPNPQLFRDNKKINTRIKESNNLLDTIYSSTNKLIFLDNMLENEINKN